MSLALYAVTVRSCHVCDHEFELVWKKSNDKSSYSGGGRSDTLP